MKDSSIDEAEINECSNGVSIENEQTEYDDWYSVEFPFEVDGEEEEDDEENYPILLYSETLHSELNIDDSLALIRSSKLSYREREKIVNVQMGNMALCRGIRGETLRSAGAFESLFSTVYELYDKIPSPLDRVWESLEKTSILKLATACWNACRDLGCGSAGNREAIRTTTINGKGGLQLLTEYLSIYDGISWCDITELHLRLLTSVIGTMRNITHSTTENSSSLHHFGVTKMLIWRLKEASRKQVDHIPSLPMTTDPWREAAFRSASTLINMSEKCPECAKVCGNDPHIVSLLIDSWGGNQKVLPLLHLGLATVLRSAKQQLSLNIYEKAWDEILNNEEQRQIVARTREEQRKAAARNKS
jgi:hypothetical protein